MGLVVKSWAVDDEPVDQEGNLVVIKCRQEGIVSYLLALIGIDPTTTLIAHPDRIEFIQASLNGVNRRIIPLNSVSSTFYGFHKPLKAVIGFILTLLFVSISAGNAIPAADRGSVLLIIFVVDFLAIIGAIIYYFLNKKVTLGIVEVAGAGFGAMIQFKRSLIEGQKIGEPEARRVCSIVQRLVESRVVA